MAEASSRPSYQQLEAEIAALRAHIASLESTLTMRDGEITRMRKPKPRVLDKNAKSAFDRPAYSR